MKWTKIMSLTVIIMTMSLSSWAAASHHTDLTAALWQAADARNAAHDSFAQALASGSREQKRIALLGLGRIGGDAVVARLLTQLNGEVSVQRYALFALGIALSEQASAPLQTLWREGKIARENRDVALMAIANTGDVTAQSVLIEAMKTASAQKDVAQLSAAAHALGQLWTYRRDKIGAPDKAAVPLLLNIIASQPEAATMAAFALSRVRALPGFYAPESLREALARSTSPRTALFLARALATPASQHDPAWVKTLAQQDKNPLVRYEAAFALARVADEHQAWQVTANLFNHVDEMTAIAALQGLSERPVVIEQHRKELETWRDQLPATQIALRYSVNRALPSETVDEEKIEPAQKVFDFAVIQSALGARYRVATERGEIQIRLNAETPYTAYNFATLADKHYFNGRVFFRVVPGFVAQTGDPFDARVQSAGNGGPGYSIREELTLNPHDEQWLGMATAGKDTGGSQFFFNVGHNPHLDWHYTTFAKIEKGVDVIAKILPGDKILRVEKIK